MALHSCVCRCPKISRNVLLKKLFLVLILQSTCLICIAWKRKQIIEQQPHRACDEWTKPNKNRKINKAASYSKWPRFLLFDLAHKHCSGIIKVWLRCLTSEAKGRFLADNILLAWYLVMVQIQFSLIIEKQDWTSRILANPPPPASDNISFLPALPPPLLPQSGRHSCITTINIIGMGGEISSFL